MAQRRRLDQLVTAVAAELMPVRRESLDAATAATLQRLQAFFEVDTVFLRHNDHDRGVTVLVDEWPRREHVPNPDPLGEVPFDADPVFGATRDLREPFVQRPSTGDADYQQRVQEGSGVAGVSMATVPLVDERTTVGVLGLVRFADRAWTDDEIRALQAIASLLTQLWARVAAEDELHRRAWQDELTGLSNRRALFAELDRRRCGSRPTAVVFLDVDNHKDVNDVLGHQIGDRVLVTLADRLRTACRAADFPARIGGDEFVVLVDGPTGEVDAYAAAQRLVGLVSEPVTVEGYELHRTVSAGVVLTGRGGTTADELLGQADTALYRAKASGRNQVVVFDQPLRDAARERFGTEVLLRRSLSEQQLELHYQPEVDLRTGRLLAVEALVRWRHPQQGLLPAGAFVEVAEETGMILDLGEWVLHEAARQAADWARQHPGLDLDVRVNVSPLQLRNEHLVQVVRACLANRSLSGKLSLEITEHALMQDVGQASALLRRLRDLGVEMALDDFGTGHSSLAQLKSLPLDYLKIDRAFVGGLGRHAADRSVLEAIIQLSEAFDLKVIAEGVESGEQVDHLLAAGCRRGQGFALARPMPPSELRPTLLAGALPVPRARSWSHPVRS